MVIVYVTVAACEIAAATVNAVSTASFFIVCCRFRSTISFIVGASYVGERLAGQVLFDFFLRPAQPESPTPQRSDLPRALMPDQPRSPCTSSHWIATDYNRSGFLKAPTSGYTLDRSTLRRPHSPSWRFPPPNTPGCERDSKVRVLATAVQQWKRRWAPTPAADPFQSRA